MRTPTLRSRSWSTRAILVLFIAAAPLAACGGDSGTGSVTNPPPPPPPPPSGPVATNSVTLQGSAFTPPAILVASGSTVSFTNQDGITHNVVFSNAAIAGASDFTSGTANVVMPATAGTYAYHCTHHSGMTGSVQVQ